MASQSKSSKNSRDLVHLNESNAVMLSILAKCSIVATFSIDIMMKQNENLPLLDSTLA